MGKIQEKIQEYKDLSEKVRIAQIHFDALGQDVVSHQDVYNLNGENKLDNCINEFKRVRLPNGQINDEGGITITCEHLLGNQFFCDIWKCDIMKQFGRFRYIKLKQELDDAIAARRAFVRSLFGFKKRSK